MAKGRGEEQQDPVITGTSPVPAPIHHTQGEGHPLLGPSGVVVMPAVGPVVCPQPLRQLLVLGNLPYPHRGLSPTVQKLCGICLEDTLHAEESATQVSLSSLQALLFVSFPLIVLQREALDFFRCCAVLISGLRGSPRCLPVNKIASGQL